MIYLAICIALLLGLVAIALFALAYRLSTDNADLVRTLATRTAKPERIPITSEEPYPPIAPGDLFRGFDPRYER